MSTYDGAYSKENHEDGAKVCSCQEDRINSFCIYHGEYRDGGFKQSKEYLEIKRKINKFNHIKDKD